LAYCKSRSPSDADCSNTFQRENPPSSLGCCTHAARPKPIQRDSGLTRNEQVVAVHSPAACGLQNSALLHAKLPFGRSVARVWRAVIEGNEKSEGEIPTCSRNAGLCRSVRAKSRSNNPILFPAKPPAGMIRSSRGEGCGGHEVLPPA